MRFRQKFLGYTGGLMMMFGLVLTLFGWETAQRESVTNGTVPHVNGAAGAPMWCGLVIIMCGLANLVEAFEKKKKREDYMLPFSVTVFFANFMALVVSAVCIGLISWSLYGRYLAPGITENTFEQAVVGLYSTIIIAACFVFIFALVAMFTDCCFGGVMSMGWGAGGPMGPPPVRESPYDNYNRHDRPSMIYK